jgi:hypothetical protein
LFPLFALGVVDTGGAPSLANIYANLRISTLIFEKKFEITLMLFSEAWRKMIHEKKPEAKNLVTLSLKGDQA